MDFINEILPLLIPLIVIQICLQVFALLHLYKRESVRFQNKWIWVPIIILPAILGPIIYFIFGEES